MSVSNTQDYSHFDKLSTEHLKEILRQDAIMDSDEGYDMDAIVYIMEVIADREKENIPEKYADVDAAWASFNKNYRPLPDGQPLYDFDDTPEDAASDAPIQHHHRAPRRNRTLYRSTLVAAILIAALFVGSVTAQALGFDLWSAFADWTRETFGFVSRESAQRDNDVQDDIPEQLQELHTLLMEHIILEDILPSYIPDGFSNNATHCVESDQFVDFVCQLTKDNESIILQYRKHTTATYDIDFEKNNENPEIYSADGVDYYIMTNLDKYFAVWSVDNIECFIHGVDSRDVLIKMVDSINGE